MTTANVSGIDLCSTTPGQTLACLSPKDHLLMMVSSRALSADLRGLACRVSLVQVEPPAIQSRYYRMLPWLSTRYYRVFTYSPQLLQRLANASRIAHGGQSIPLDRPLEAKSAGISLLASAKRSTQGHRLRHRLASWAATYSPQLQILGRGFRPVDCVSRALSPFHFSVVIENSRYFGYFIEKLIDCFYCRTVPIYWGDPSISDIFDTRGMICCENLQQLINAIQTVDVETYDRMQSYLDENRKRAEAFRSQMVTRAAEELADLGRRASATAARGSIL